MCILPVRLDLSIGEGLDGDGEEVVGLFPFHMTYTHAPCLAPTHARPSLPINQTPNLVPPLSYRLALHDTAASVLEEMKRFKN